MITVCHPGRYGDLLWALPTIRSLVGTDPAGASLLLPTDPANTTPMREMVPLLKGQRYLRSGVHVVDEWSITQDAPRFPRFPPEGSMPLGTISLGYQGWPLKPLPYEALEIAGIVAELAPVEDKEFFRPWVRVPSCANEFLGASRIVGLHNWRTSGVEPDPEGRWIRQHYGEPAGILRTEMYEIVVHWTDRYHELKLGILSEIRRLLPKVRVRWYAQEGSRMHQAGAVAVDIPTLAYILQQYDVLLTDCSCAHVLGAAVGVERVLVVEPEEARHHPIFWPGSRKDDGGWWHQQETVLGQRIIPVLGGDHRPTFDARHTVEYIERALALHGKDWS